MPKAEADAPVELVLGFPGFDEAAQRLAEAAGLPLAQIDIHRFPDGESRVCLPTELPSSVAIYCSLVEPNAKLIELAMVSATARELGVKRLVLVAPYLCYMRQDKAFHKGEAVSQRIVGKLLADWFDELITVDPHLHRVHELSQAVPAKRSLSLHATDPIAEYLMRQLDNPLLIGPDEESEQWIAAVAKPNGLDYGVGRKQRLGDSEVRVTLPSLAYEGRNVVVLDDMASTGRTLEATVNALVPHKPATITLAITHALFMNNAAERLSHGAVQQIISTDSIPHSSNRIHLAELLAAAL